jgi:hypothetical protein
MGKVLTSVGQVFFEGLKKKKKKKTLISKRFG